MTSGAVLRFIGHELTRRGPLSPALVKHEAERANNVQSRIADAITGFAGSMSFVYVHIVWFASWIVLGIEKYPYGLLTMIVSLEAIFLSTFLMVTQNRQAARSDIRSQLDFETNLRSEIWSVHIGAALSRPNGCTRYRHGARDRGDARGSPPPLRLAAGTGD